MRNVTSLGAGWRYLPRFEDAFVDPRLSLVDWASVDIPHTNLELPYNAFDEKSYQFVSTYARDVDVPELTGGERAFLDFEGVMAACDVWVNGKRAGGHLGGFTPFSIEVTSLVTAGANRVLVRVDSTERADIPPFGHVVDYLCYGGIYRGVGLRIQEAAFIKSVFAKPRDALAARKSLEVEVTVDAGSVAASSGSGGEREGEGLSARVRLMDGARVAAEAVAPIAPSSVAGAARDAGSDGGLGAVIQLRDIEGLRAWDLDDPVLYPLEVELLCGGATIDAERHRIGFRIAEWKPDGFFLNGRRIVIRGLNRHQAFPWQGYAMPARVQRRDAEILKRELGVNLVRTSHYPQAKAFLDACDELGLLVLEEFPGWQHIGDEVWKDNACEALREMVLRDRNRPAIVLWGVRINESKDDHGFYARTNDIAHRLDPTRARGGVRCIDKSELLEDVYTFNDFVFDGGKRVLRKPRSVTRLGRDVPYLVTEYNGHMYPAKRFDNEERLAEHARRHAAVVDAAASTKSVSGAIGWCAFDYNTHKDFGSGDRICYHGVSDMFRIPKYAAALYASQRDPAEGVVLEAACIFAKGERCAATLLPIDIYTNCDEVALWRGGKRIGSFLPDRGTWPHLRHPPVVVRDLVGDQLADSDFSLRDRAAIRRIAGKVLTVGYQNLGLADKIAMGLLLVRNHLSLAEAEALFGKFTIGWGAADESWDLVGLVDGKEVARRRYGGDAVPAALQLRADDLRLLAEGAAGAAAWGDAPAYLEGWDATRIEVRLVDQYGNIVPFAAEAIDIEVEGPGAIAGPKRFAFLGGCAAFWVRTTGRPGTIRVRASCGRFAAGELVIEAD